jgi:hypothetical protein
LETIAAVATDVGHLMDALPPLTSIVRYGNVRKTDSEMVRHVIDGLVTRICVGLPGACGGINEEAAEEIFAKINAVNGAIALLQKEEQTRMWREVLLLLANAPTQNGIVAGRATRLLLDANEMKPTEAARRFSLALSRAHAPEKAASWLDGFIRGSGLLLLHDDSLWKVLDDWVTSLTQDHFTATLPLLRRTFASFRTAERRQLGTRVASGGSSATNPGLRNTGFDEQRAKKSLPLLAQLLGLNPPQSS